MIYPCTCANEYQDKLYGKGRRVWNPMGPQGKSGVRCSSCGKENKAVVAKKPDKETADSKV